MRLEKLFTHRLIRAFRIVLPLVVVILVAIPVRNYWLRTHQRSAQSPRTPQLPKDLSLRTDNFNHSVYHGNRMVFTIHAGTNLGTTDNKNVLQDVEVTMFWYPVQRQRLPSRDSRISPSVGAAFRARS